ncbi:HAD family hydrolase [Palleronia sp.]|uniref:HAD family hydrolase n=1 Tax=Palleronia sp. TaxID=1940284 RepID=UPI0035C7FF73
MTVAMLFDLDGTLIHSDPIHAAVFIELFAEQGIEIDEAHYYDHIHGRLNEDIFGDAFPGADAKALADEKEARFRERLGTAAEPMSGLLPLLDRIKAAGWRTAIVTNAPRTNADAMLAAIGLSDHFDTLVVSDELERGKPDPLPYLTALDRLGGTPARALAFEDSPSGVTAAARAGIATMGLRSSLTHERLTDAGAVATLADFSDPALAPWIDRITKETT